MIMNVVDYRLHTHSWEPSLYTQREQTFRKWSTLPSPSATLRLTAEGKQKEYGYRCQSQLNVLIDNLHQPYPRHRPNFISDTFWRKKKKNHKWPGKNVLERGGGDGIIIITACHLLLPNSPTICPRHDIDSCVQDTDISLPQAQWRHLNHLSAWETELRLGKKYLMLSKKGANMKCPIYQRD